MLKFVLSPFFAVRRIFLNLRLIFFQRERAEFKRKFARPEGFGFVECDECEGCKTIPHGRFFLPPRHGSPKSFLSKKAARQWIEEAERDRIIGPEEAAILHRQVAESRVPEEEIDRQHYWDCRNEM